METTKKYLIEYLKKKKIQIQPDGYGRLVWEYECENFKYHVKMYFENPTNSFYNDKNYHIIKYSSSIYVKNLQRRRTSTKPKFGINVYKTLMYAKEFFDKHAKQQKNEKDLKTKYCTELESYYNRIHDKVNVLANKSFDGKITIFISGWNNNGKSTYYAISCDNGDYYLISKTENYESVKDFQHFFNTEL